jgi:hypothetical protein
MNDRSLYVITASDYFFMTIVLYPSIDKVFVHYIYIYIYVVYNTE